MIKGIGTDIIEVERIEKAITRHGAHFLETLFTENERNYCLQHKDSSRHFAGRFAAKEAIMKAIGTGLTAEVSWLDIEILNDPYGKPVTVFSDRFQHTFGKIKLCLSISHCKAYATAVAIWEEL